MKASNGPMRITIRYKKMHFKFQHKPIYLSITLCVSKCVGTITVFHSKCCYIIIVLNVRL